MTKATLTPTHLSFTNDAGDSIASYPSWSAFTILDLLIEVYRHPILMHWGWRVPWSRPGIVLRSAFRGGFSIISSTDTKLHTFFPDIQFVGADGCTCWVSTHSFMGAVFSFLNREKPKRWDLKKTWFDGTSACCAIGGIPQGEDLKGAAYATEILSCEERSLGGFLYLRHETRGLVPVWEALADVKNALFISMEGLK